MNAYTVTFTINVPGKKEETYGYVLYDRQQAKNMALAFDESPFISHVTLTAQTEEPVDFR